MRRNVVATFLVVLLGLPVLAAGPNDELLKADRDFCQAVRERRIDGWMDYMSENAALGIGNGTPRVGREAIRQAMQTPFGNPNFSLVWEPTRAEVFPNGKMGYTVGRWTRTVKDDKGEHVTHGTYITVWQMQPDGRWLVIADGGADDPSEKAKS